MTFKGKEEIVQQTTKATENLKRKKERNIGEYLTDIIPFASIVLGKYRRTVNHISIVTSTK